MLCLRFFGSILACAGIINAQVDLGTALSFAILGGTTVTNTGPSTIDGDVGVSPGTAITGFPPGMITNGVIHMADAVAAQAQADVTTAYNAAAGQPSDDDLTGQDLGGMTLAAGVYTFSSSAQLTGDLTLDGQGDSSSVWIFQIGSTLTTATAASVILVNNASPCNVFWQVGSSATIGTATNFAGNVLALTSISMVTGASSNGGLYARNGAVTLDTNDVNAGLTCPPVPTTTMTTTTTGSATTTTTSTGPATTTTSTDLTTTTITSPVTTTSTTGLTTTTTTGLAITTTSTDLTTTTTTGPATTKTTTGPATTTTTTGPVSSQYTTSTVASHFSISTMSTITEASESVSRPTKMVTAIRHILKATKFTVTCSVAPTAISLYGQTFSIETPCTTVLTATPTLVTDSDAFCQMQTNCKGCATPTPHCQAYNAEVSSNPCSTCTHQGVSVSNLQPSMNSTKPYQPGTLPDSTSTPLQGSSIVTAAATTNWPDAAIFAAVALFAFAIELL